MKRLIISITLICSLQLANATNYYVSNDGNNGSNGSASNPWQTMHYSVQQLSDGDTLFVMPGIYNEYCTIEQQATANNPIVITTKPGFEQQAIMDGTGVTILYQGEEDDNGGLIQMVNASHIHVSNIKFINSPKEGIIAFDCSNITMDNLYASQSQSSGIMSWGSSNIVIKNCRVENACLGQLQEYITLGATTFFEVKNCLVQYSDMGSVKEGIDAKDGSNNGIIAFNTVKGLQSAGIYLDAWTEETGLIDVYNNKVENCNGIALASEGGGHLHDINIYNNISYNNINYGIVFGNWGDHPANTRPISNVNIYHNTIVNNGTSGDWDIGISLENQYLSNISITNNIVSDNAMCQINNESNLTNHEINVSGNLIYGDTTNIGELTEAIDIYADPLLIASSNFQPLANSPVIDVASPNNQVNFDFSLGNRPHDGDNNGSAITDIGAWEFSSSMLIKKNVESTIGIYPNPSTGIINIENMKQWGEISIVSITGNIVYTSTIKNSMKTVVDLSDLSKGIYFVTLQKNNKLLTQKIIME